jgi:hypothetical protein
LPPGVLICVVTVNSVSAVLPLVSRLSGSSVSEYGIVTAEVWM